MTPITPKDFAGLIRKTHEVREASWVKIEDSDFTTGRYDLSYTEAASQVCPSEWAMPVAILLISGFADVDEWCHIAELG